MFWKDAHAKLFPSSVLGLQPSPLLGMHFWLCFTWLTPTHPFKLHSEVTLARKALLGAGLGAPRFFKSALGLLLSFLPPHQTMSFELEKSWVWVTPVSSRMPGTLLMSNR